MPTAPSSPPKRMTRARAKAVEEKAKTTAATSKTSTVSSRAAAAATAATKASASKRKIPAEDDTDAAAAPPATRAARKVSTKPTVAQSRRGVTTAKLAADAKASAESKETVEAPEDKTKARSSKNMAPRSLPNAATTTTKATTTTGPATRTRARVEPATKSSVTKKKVTFVNGSNEDKENVKIGTSKGDKANKASTTQSSKPNSTATSRNTTVSSGRTKPETISNKPKATPLSPKKDSQVAKGNATEDSKTAKTCSDAEAMESDDELNNDPAPSISPNKTTVRLMMNSPARRPPPSPFKDAMLGSPRRMVLSQHDSLSRVSGSDMSVSNMLNQSPRKLKILSPFKESSTTNSSDATQSSLFGSPARRPASPIKSLVLTAGPGDGSPRKGAPESMLASRSPLKFTPAKDLSAQVKAAEVEAIKTRLMSIEEQAAALEDELLSCPSPFSSIKKMEALPSDDEEQLEKAEMDEDDQTRQEIDEADAMDIDTEALITPRVHSIHFEPRSPVTPAAIYQDEESEDELSSDNVYHSTPATHKRRLSSHFRPVETPQTVPAEAETNSDAPEGSLTVLAQRFGQWQGATPDSEVVKNRQATRSVFSPLPHLARPGQEENDSTATSAVSTPDSKQEQTASFFDQAMPIQIHEDEEEDTNIEQAEEDEKSVEEMQEYFGQSQMSEASQVYGDENQSPGDANLFRTFVPLQQTCTPERICEDRPRVIHTVSKVPLKGCDDEESPAVVISRKRSQSLVGQLSPHAHLELQAMRQIHPSAASIEAELALASPSQSQNADLSQMVAGVVETPRRITTAGENGTQATPVAATPRADASLLRGAVVFVDVHTSEGADASGLFIDLLSQMGAKCVKSWSWNPSRASSVEEDDGTPPPSTPNSKVGITHVVFKDGGKRTMEKVREAHGRVMCVGVGWVLDCERHNQWLDELDYAIDISTVPRGGSRRRKSMEPKALAQHNGELFSTVSPRKVSPTLMSPTKEFLNLGSPNRRVSSAAVEAEKSIAQLPTTPQARAADANDYSTPPPYSYPESSFGSPTTPYFLHPTQLVQQTCPPKQSQELFFPVSGKIDEHPDAAMRARLVLARRKSLQFAPKVGSPLSRRGDN